MLKAKGILFSLILVVAISFVTNQQVNAQSKLHIPQGIFLSINGNLNLSGVNSAKYTTAQGAHISFTQGSSWSGASNKEFIDGYVKVAHNKAFVFPIGANGQYRPVAITGGAKTTAAFIDTDPGKIKTQQLSKAAGKSIGNPFNQLEIDQLSSEGFWDIKGTNAAFVSFSWGANSKIAELTNGEIEKLQVIGWSNGAWEIIPSSIDKYSLDMASHQLIPSKSLSNFINGSITTNNEIIPSDYDYFTLGAVNVATLEGQTTFSLYPNPSLTKLPLNVQYQLPDVAGGTLKVFSSNGALLAEQTLAGDHGTIALRNVTNIPGAYSVSITNSKGETVTKKLVVAAE